jgi:hypothetical protein
VTRLYIKRRRLAKWNRTSKKFDEYIDYRCEYGRFPASTSCVTISNPDSFSSSGTKVDPGIRSLKRQLSDWTRYQEAICGIYFKNKWRAGALQPGLEFHNSKKKKRLKSGSFKCTSWLKGSFLGSDDWGFLKEGVKTCVMAQMLPLKTPTFLCFHICSLWMNIAILKLFENVPMWQARTTLVDPLPSTASQLCAYLLIFLTWRAVLSLSTRSQNPAVTQLHSSTPNVVRIHYRWDDEN